MKLEIDKSHKTLQHRVWWDQKVAHTLLSQSVKASVARIHKANIDVTKNTIPLFWSSCYQRWQCNLLQHAFCKEENDTFSLFWYSVILKEVDHICEIAEKIPQKHFEGNCSVRPSKLKLMTRMKDCHYNLLKIQGVDKNLHATPV
jgi:hypothetical protein